MSDHICICSVALLPTPASPTKGSLSSHPASWLLWLYSESTLQGKWASDLSGEREPGRVFNSDLSIHEDCVDCCLNTTDLDQFLPIFWWGYWGSAMFSGFAPDHPASTRKHEDHSCDIPIPSIPWYQPPNSTSSSVLLPETKGVAFLESGNICFLERLKPEVPFHLEFLIQYSRGFVGRTNRDWGRKGRCRWCQWWCDSVLPRHLESSVSTSCEFASVDLTTIFQRLLSYVFLRGAEEGAEHGLRGWARRLTKAVLCCSWQSQ